jgi:hypothetical protein
MARGNATRYKEALLESLTDAQGKCVTVHTLGDVGTKIDMIRLAQFESQPAATAGQEVAFLKQLTGSGDDSADTAECDQAKPLRQDQAILQLRGQLVAIEVPACSISPQVIVGPIYAVPVERGLPGNRAEKGVIGKNLIFAQTRIFAKRSAVRLEGILAAQCLGKEVSCESEKSSIGRIESVESGIPGQPCTNGPQCCVETDVRGNRNGGDIGWPNRNKRMSG